MSKKRQSPFSGKVAQDAQRQKSQGSAYGYLNLPKGVSVFKVESAGSVNLDFIPYEITDEKHLDHNEDTQIALVGDLWYKKPFYTHRDISSSNETVICLKTIGKKCPICEYRAQMIKAGSSKEETDALKPKLRNLYIVIPVGHKKMEETIHIWDVSQFLFQTLLNDEIDEGNISEEFPDIENGTTLKVRFEEKKFNKNSFFEVKRVDEIDRKSEYDESILDEVPNLDEVLNIMSYEKLEKLFLEDVDPEDEDVDDEGADDVEDDQPVTRRRKKVVVEDEDEEEPPVRKRKKVVEDDEEEPPVRKKRKPVEEDPEEDEEEPPKRSRKAAKEEDPEEDEDEPPVRRRGMTVRDREAAEEAPTRRKRPVEDSDQECPHDHKFGKDTDQFDDCDDCKIWNACDKAFRAKKK